jgi:hypothetical protein
MAGLMGLTELAGLVKKMWRRPGENWRLRNVMTGPLLLLEQQEIPTDVVAEGAAIRTDGPP